MFILRYLLVPLAVLLLGLLLFVLLFIRFFCLVWICHKSVDFLKLTHFLLFCISNYNTNSIIDQRMKKSKQKYGIMIF